MLQSIQALILTITITAFSFADILITEISDQSTNTRFIEFYNNGSSSIDLSDWQAHIFSNGSTNSGGRINLPESLDPGAFWVVCKNSSDFEAAYGTGICDSVDGQVSSNGDDVYALFNSTYDSSDLSNLVDLFGEIGVDGTGTCWQHNDASASRISTSATPSFNCDDWDFTEINVDDPSLANPGEWDGASGVNTCDDETACNTGEEGDCNYADTDYDCDGNCTAADVEWAGDQDSDGYLGFDGSTVYIKVESFPNLGSATLTVNGSEVAMDYEDWGANAHFYSGFDTDASTTYDWSVTVSNSCGASQTVSDSFSTDCNNDVGGTAVLDECDVCGGDGSSCGTCDDETACNTGELGACEYIVDGACDCDGNVEDCAGTCGGDATEDACGDCNGPGIPDGECDCDGNVEDCAGTCGGDASEDCAGTCGGDAVIDSCDVCGGTNDCWPSVTFNVNMSLEDVSDDGVSLYGIDGDWWDGIAMTDDDGDGTFSTTVKLSPELNLYKFKNGGSWEDVDELECAWLDDPDGDGWGYWDRYINLEGVTEDQTLDSVCFGSCEDCPNEVSGCTDPLADNYNSEANVDDDSCEYTFEDPANLFFSEYAEGSSNNKYLEIFNASDDDVDLSGYSLSSCTNGCDDGMSWDYPDNVTFDEATIASGDVFVVCHGSADDIILAECDQTSSYLSNGDDVYALTQIGSGIILDIIGVVGDDPGSGFDVAGISNGTKDHTLVRKSSVSAGNALWLDNVDADTGEVYAYGSAGHNADDSEWIVLDQNTWDYLGSHTIDTNETECLMGDIDGDQDVNVLDIVAVVGYIVNGTEIDIECADFDGDGAITVLDVVALVNGIVNPRLNTNDATSAKLIKSINSLSIQSNGYIGGIQMTLKHMSNFSIDITNNAWITDYSTNRNKTTLVMVAPEEGQLFITNDSFEIVELIVANSHESVKTVIAKDFSLSNAYPNPFNPSTTVDLTLTESGYTSLMIYNLNGQLIEVLANSYMDPDHYQFIWNANDTPSGIYILRLEYAGQTSTQKLMLLK